MSIVQHPDGTQREVRNLGWLLRHRWEVTSLNVTHPADPENAAQLCAVLNDGRRYVTDFASLQVLWRWLHRPSMRYVPLSWFGRYYLGGVDSSPRDRNSPPTFEEKSCIASS